MPPADSQLVPAVDRAIRMLVALRGESAGRGISALARDLDIPKSSAFQIATTLVHHGILECDEETRRYRLGPGLHLFAGERDGRADLPLLAARHLRALARDTGLTALLGIPTAAGTVLAGKADSPLPLGIDAPLGFELEPLAGAFGKLFAAALPAARRSELLRRGLPRYTERSIVDTENMERELERVRRNGFATDVEEYLDGIRAVAAPVHDADGSVAGALCALGVAVRLKRDALPAIIEATRTAARGLSRDLGADPRGREVA